MSSCLLIVDVQEGFINEHTRHIPDEIIRLISQNSFDHIVASQFINNPDSPHYQMTHWKKMMSSESQKLVPDLERSIERVFRKSVNSCFTDEFHDYIKEEEIDFLYLVGIDTDCCVLKTAFDCFDLKLGFKVVLNCCASTGGKSFHDSARDIMRRSLGEDAIIEELF